MVTDSDRRFPETILLINDAHANKAKTLMLKKSAVVMPAQIGTVRTYADL